MEIKYYYNIILYNESFKSHYHLILYVLLLLNRKTSKGDESLNDSFINICRQRICNIMTKNMGGWQSLVLRLYFNFVSLYF